MLVVGCSMKGGNGLANNGGGGGGSGGGGFVFPYNGTAGVRTGNQIVKSMLAVTGSSPTATGFAAIANQAMAQLPINGQVKSLNDNTIYTVLGLGANVALNCVVARCNGIIPTTVTLLTPSTTNDPKAIAFSSATNDTIINNLFMAALQRAPSADELAAAETLASEFGAVNANGSTTQVILRNYLIALISGVFGSPQFLGVNS